MSISVDQQYALMLRRCESSDELHAWVKMFLNLNIPRIPVCPGHSAPFDYLSYAYFEPARDLVVWAPRGGGKTRLAAMATLLDLLHKPGSAVRILGGSVEQSMKVWEHLLPDLEKLGSGLLKRRPGARSLQLVNGSGCAALTQSMRAVRGLRIQKLRCDEVELFKPDIWEAAQMVTHSRNGIKGSIDALSTLHSPWGLMHRIIESAEASNKTIVRWCLLDVLQACPAERECPSCPLLDDCRGIAKTRCDGFVGIDDAIRMKQRTGRETWEAEMLCQRPSVKRAVFPSFAIEAHVRDTMPGMSINAVPSLAIDFGFANAFVCLWIVAQADGRTLVLDEYVQEQRTLDEHLEQIQSRPWGQVRQIACDPAGAGRNEQTAQSNITLLRRKGYQVKHRKSLIVEGLELIRTALRPALGEPTLFIHPRCRRLIQALQGYRYSTNGGELPIKDGTHDHLIDALRYHYVNQGRWEVKSRGY